MFDMAKVICTGPLRLEKYHGKYQCPEIGQEYTVIGQEDGNNGLLMYVLAEFPIIGRIRFIWDARAFSTLNGPDERGEAYQSSRLTETDRMLQLCADMMPAMEMPAPSWERLWQGIVRKEEGGV